VSTPAPGIEHTIGKSSSITLTAQYGVTVFLGAFLLFLVEPLLAKYFLPWFGGAAAVWTTCMLFFQLLLLAGYAYAHGLVSKVNPQYQAVLHCSILLASLILLVCLALTWPSPLTPGANWKPSGDAQPIIRLLVLLSVSIGLPYFVLASTGPLLQSWFSRTPARESTYRLYALSNLASFLALLSYPFLLEPWLPLKMQAHFWSLAFVAYALVCGYCAIRARRRSEPEPSANGEDEQITEAVGHPDKPGPAQYALWLILAACGSTMFLASTNQICQNIAIVPLLWIVPLSLYLLSFVICFEKPKWYVRGPYHLAFALCLFAACYVLSGGAVQSIVVQVAVYSCTLFVACMICHGELYRKKPAPRFLTSFYLMVAAGGAIGGIFVAVLAPYAFRFSWEYELGLWATVVLMFIVLLRDRRSWLYSSRFGMSALVMAAVILPLSPAAAAGVLKASNLPVLIVVLIAAILLADKRSEPVDLARARAAWLYCGICIVIVGTVLTLIARSELRSAVLLARNFYGVLAVRDESAHDPEWERYKLVHGRVPHGWQFRAADKRDLPTSYYGTDSGIGQALIELRQRQAQSGEARGLRIGVIGLGIGTLAAYGRAEDYFRFYEINPNVVRIAENPRYFTYLQDCRSRKAVVLGDARLSMENELRRNNSQQFDLLVIDAFSGDAIPVHLLTKEAFAIYLQQIREPNGVIAVHISNTYLDLRPVIEGVAQRFGLGSVAIHDYGDGVTTVESLWMVLSRDRELLNSLSGRQPTASQRRRIRKPVLWTDEYSNLFYILRWY
jgi:spermidine synthase